MRCAIDGSDRISTLTTSCTARASASAITGRLAGSSTSKQTSAVLGSSAPRQRRDYANRRAEMWDRMRKWLRTGALPDDADLISDLKGPEYGFDSTGHILLEKKEKMKARGLASPDAADALALTFADPVAANRRLHQRFMARTSFNPL